MNPENYAQRIIQEVEKRKQRAVALGIKQAMLYLFFNGGYGDFRYTRFCKSSIISNFNWDKSTYNKCEFTLKGKEYIVSYAKVDSTIDTGKLEISIDGKKVLAMPGTYCEDHNSGATRYMCWDVEAFVEGEWVNDFKNLINQVKIEEDEENRKNQEERRRQEEAPDRIQKLKEDFGIE